MSSLALLQSLKESILSQANVKAIYGEPVAAHGKTVIPVAKIMYGYGAGAGTGGVGTSSARGEWSTDPFRSDYRPQEIGWSRSRGNRSRHVARLAQTALSATRVGCGATRRAVDLVQQLSCLQRSERVTDEGLRFRWVVYSRIADRCGEG